MKNYVRLLLGCMSVVAFTQCGFFAQNNQVISPGALGKMMQGTFTNHDDVISVFPKSVADVQARKEFILDHAKTILADIKKITADERTFANSPQAIDRVSGNFSIIAHGLNIIEMVHPEKPMRDACHEAVQDLQKFAVDAFMNKEIYAVFTEYVNGNMKKEKLSDEQQYFIDEEMRGFKRMGFHLPDEQFEKVKALQKEIAEVSMTFDRNIAEDKSQIVVEKDVLAGVDEHFVKSLEQTDDGKYILKTDYPTRSEIMAHCSEEETRKQFSRSFSNRAYPVNEDLLKQIIAKRHELAKLLGFKSFAHLDLDDQMVKDPKRAHAFITDLAQKVTPKEQQEFDRLTRELPAGITLEDGKFKPWDYSFVKEMYKKKHFNVDDREIAKYFPMEKTVEGIFDIYQKVLNVRFELIKPDNVWHDDVKLITVYHKDNDNVIGYILLDMHPREGKYSHACMADMVAPIKKTENGKEVTIPSACIVIANFPKSTADRPSLLKHSDVTTFFHEFGHAMHQVLAVTEMVCFAGTNTKTDFVELPSQMFEEWMWDKEMLKNVSSHYETGEPLSDELIDKMIELKRFDSGYFVKSQNVFALLSLAYFMDGEEKDLYAIAKSHYEKYLQNFIFDSQNHFYVSWGHLTGYGAKYYGYMWSKVFALDVFDTIRKHGLLDEKIGATLVEKILSKGGSVEPDQLLKDFLGRAPKQDAFLKDIGVI